LGCWGGVKRFKKEDFSTGTPEENKWSWINFNVISPAVPQRYFYVYKISDRIDKKIMRKVKNILN
jgi:hypothetical protein